MNKYKSISEKRSLSSIINLLLGMLVIASIQVNEAHAAPPTWQASSAIAASTGVDVTVTLPAHQLNDILLLQVVVRDVNDTITWPAGWAQIATVDRGTAARYWWAWKRAASGTETNPLVDKNTTTGDTYAAVTTYRGAILTGDPWEVKGTPNTSTVAAHVLNGITTLSAESLIVASLCGENNTAGSGTTFSATDPTSLAQVLYVESGTGSDGACTAGAAAKTAIGATGNVTATWTNTLVGSGGIVLALKPPPIVLSINRADANPTSANTSVSWTVVFNTSVTGVDASDFSLVQAGGVTGASITSVTGSGTTWTVTANTGTGTVGTLGLNLVDNDTIVDSASRPLGGAGAGNGNFTGQVYSLSLIVNSINRASANPTIANTAVSWTVIFSASVTGVDASDFSLIQAGGATGASITSVTGSGTTWTVTANTGTGQIGTLGLNLVDNDTIMDASSNRLGGTGNGNGNFTGEIYTICSPSTNIPVGVSVSCICDAFGRTTLNPSTIFGANWIVSTSDTTGIVPSIDPTSGYLRLTNRTANNAKAATVPGIFPAAGNYISVEFRHFAYNSANSGNVGNCASNTGADGIAVTLSDYSITAVPGAFGGSLGYAQRTGIVGFAGGWVGIALDEWGNYQNPTEGRDGGPGPTCESVGVRGSGSGAGIPGYPWVGGSGTLTPRIDNHTSTTPAPGYYYQVIVDARNAGNPTPETFISVGRDTAGTGTYASLVPAFDVFAANPAQAAVPDNWQISFTGSTGGSNNIHEIGGLRICAQTVAPPSGGTAGGFNAIDEAYATSPATPAVQNFLSGHIYMKVAGNPFKLWVAALGSNQILTTYAASGNKDVIVKLVDNSDGVCVIDNSQAGYCNAACTAKTAVSGGSQTLTFALSNAGKKQSADFTINTAYKNLVAIISDDTTSACSTDAFSVRPTGVSSVTSSNATNTGTGGTPIFKAGGDTFNLTATIAGIAGSPSGYTGTLKINSAAMQPLSPATVLGTLAPVVFPAATSGTPNSTATGNSFTYSEVGGFYFLGYPVSNATAVRGVYEGVNVATDCPAMTPAQCDVIRAPTWTGVDSISTKGNCVSSNYSNTKDASGKYGCLFGLTADSGGIGRFTPAYLSVVTAHGCGGGAAFTYSAQPFRVTVIPYNGLNANTLNYTGTIGLAKAVTMSDPNGAVNCPSGLCFANNGILASAFSNVSSVVSGSTSPIGGPGVPITYAFQVPKEKVPLALTLRAVDDDGISSLYNNGVTTVSYDGSTEIRSGRVSISNAYGSELADLPMPMQIEYYVDTSITAPTAPPPPTTGWIANSADTCSSVSLSALVYNPGNLSSGDTCVQDNGGSGNSGQGCGAAGPLAPVNEQFLAFPKITGPTPPSIGSYNLYLRAPGAGNDGSVDVTANLSSKTWLRYDWNGTGEVDPTGRATFGLFRGSPRHIYLRQRFN